MFLVGRRDIRSYSQSVDCKVSDIELLKRETIKSLFYEYFDAFIFAKLKKYVPVKDYCPEFDTAGEYPTPYAIMRQNKSPICFYPILSNDRCKEVTIIIQHYELNEFHPDIIVVFENQVSISRITLARLSNLGAQQFATLTGNENRIKDHTERMYV